MIKKVRGRIPAIVAIFKSRLRDTVVVTLPQGGKITIHIDGTVSKSSVNFRSKGAI